MNERSQRLVSLRNPWFTASVGAVIALFVFGALVGFVWLPSAQNDALFKGLLNSICSAAGVPRSWLSETAAPPLPANASMSRVRVTPTMLRAPNAESIGRGATLALRCTMCHGERGVSDAKTPNLAGQFAPSIYKELRDFQSGARFNASMSPMVVGLNDQDLRDLSAYYASLPRVPAVRSSRSPGVPEIVASGAPLRNVAPCAACHGGVATKVGAPWLDGQPATYLSTQLNAFAHGTRRNDISEQMRNIARNMTAQEIDASVRYYAGGH